MTADRRPVPVSLLLALLAVLTLGITGASAQERIAIFSEPGTPVIATELLVVSGPLNEPEDRPGIAHLAARAVTEPIRPVLDSLGAHLALEVQKDALSFTLIAAPDVWEEATRVLMIALFRDPPTSAVVQRERVAVRAELVARQTNPADAMAREADRAFFGASHPWGRPSVGTVRSLERLTLSDVDDFLRDHVTSDRALATVVGPVDPERVRAHLDGFMLGRGRLSVDVPRTAPAPRPVRVDYNSITTWISISYPFDPGADEEALRLLAHLVLESLTSGPERHLVFNASATLVPRVGGGELRFQVVTPPAAADRLSARIAETLRQLARGAMHEDVWETRLRRYRGERLQELSSPEARAREAARTLLTSSGERWLLPALDVLPQERLSEAVRSLGEPVTVFLGPSLD